MWTIDLFLIANIVVFLYIWLDTDAFIEWAALFKLNWTKHQDYHAFRNGPTAMMAKTYSEFLAFKYGSCFWIKLITCPECLGVWANLIVMVAFSKLSLHLLGCNIILTWLFYSALKWTLSKLNE